MDETERDPTPVEAPPERRHANIRSAYESIAPGGFRNSLTSLWEIDDPDAAEDEDAPPSC